MLDNLNTFANFIQIASYEKLLEQASNDDLFEELQHQNKEYLQQILKNQSIIIQMLERLENESKSIRKI